MSTSTKLVSHFFEPGALLPILPLLTSQTDLSFLPISSPTIIFCEEIRIPSRLLKRHSSKADRSIIRARSTSPYTKPSIVVAKHSSGKSAQVAFALPASNLGRHALSVPSDSTASETEKTPSPRSRVSPIATSLEDDDDHEDEEEDEEELTIPKPVGEVGRPFSGGYNLQRALGWSHKTFSKLQVSFFTQ